MSPKYESSFIETYSSLSNHSEEYYLHCEGFLLEFLSSLSLAGVDSIKPHLNLLEMLYSIRSIGGRDLTRDELFGHLEKIRSARTNSYDLPDLATTNPDWQKVKKLFTDPEYPEPIIIPKKTLLLYLITGFDRLVPEANWMTLSRAAQWLHIIYGDIGCNLYFLKDQLNNRTSGHSQFLKEIDRLFDVKLETFQSNSFLFYCAASFARAGASIEFIDESFGKTPDFKITTENKSWFVECTATRSNGKTILQSFDDAIKSKGIKFENGRFSPGIIALEYNHWLNNEKMEIGIPLEKKENWLIAKVLNCEKEFPEMELKPLLQLFQNQTSINMILILQAHLACVKGRFIENEMLRRYIVREGEPLPSLPKERWIAWEVPLRSP